MSELVDTLKSLAPQMPDPAYRSLHPEFHPRLDRLRQLLRQQGLETSVGSGLRDAATQARLYAQGRTSPGPIVTHAAPGSSYHNYGAAVDLVPKGMSEDAAGRLVGKTIQTNPDLGLTWGGTFRNLYDPLHVQLGVPLAELQRGNYRPTNDQPSNQTGQSPLFADRTSASGPQGLTIDLPAPEHRPPRTMRFIHQTGVV